MTLKVNETKCVIFDCDGVLVDSEKLCCKALVNVFSKYNDQISIEDCMAHFQGGKVADILTATIERLNIKVSLDDVEPLYRTQVQQLFHEELEPVAGISELLDRLTVKGLQYCVVSNSPKTKIERSLELTGLLDRFKGKVFSAFDANSWKPEPDLLLYAAMSMGYSPKECLYIDDTAKGVVTGLSAGIQTIYYRSSAYSPLFTGDALEIEKMSELELLIS